ncbi:MAG: DUF1330 domain-containing protein [Gammaproteobacteria bacterium]|nr:MAG: DUF1330 domain-containing protein [Gammaproteobacteria bacterium]
MAGYRVIRGSAIREQGALNSYAEVIAGEGAVETREGPHFPRQLIVRFDSYQQALDCYEDPEYRRAMEFAQRAYDRQLSILEG